MDCACSPAPPTVSLLAPLIGLWVAALCTKDCGRYTWDDRLGWPQGWPSQAVALCIQTRPPFGLQPYTDQAVTICDQAR